ncbi:MAG: GNAT family N-acetyltransferase [Anaerolineales bacterium]|nr:GNAT family N-acetyltransferase [Anaerolineales bacterium]
MDIRAISQADVTPWAELMAAAFDRPQETMVQLWPWLQQGDGLLAWGAWDGARLAAQYSCLLTSLWLPGTEEPARVGMSINMAVHPDYRGQGLIKQVSQPVYAALAALGGVAGVGFSNAAGVKVDRHSKGYGYQVVGQMQPHLVMLRRAPHALPLSLTAVWPCQPWAFGALPDERVRFRATAVDVQRRFAQHPFRRYQFGVWREGEEVCGVVVYRTLRRRGAALLAAYGAEMGELLRRWATAVYQNGIRYIHCLTTPQAALRPHLHALGPAMTLPWTRTPYFLTVKCLDEGIRPLLTDFGRWDCMGGDIL